MFVVATYRAGAPAQKSETTCLGCMSFWAFAAADGGVSSGNFS